MYDTTECDRWLWQKLEGGYGGPEKLGWTGAEEEGWTAVLSGVVWVDLFEKVTFDPEMKKVREAKGRARQGGGAAGAQGRGREQAEELEESVVPRNAPSGEACAFLRREQWFFPPLLCSPEPRVELVPSWVFSPQLRRKRPDLSS